MDEISDQNMRSDVECLADQEQLESSMMEAGDKIVTMTGTIKRSKSLKRDRTEIVEVQVRLSTAEIRKLTEEDKLKRSSLFREKNTDQKRKVSLRKGPHVTIWTLFCMPWIFIIAACVNFYYGSVTWYNIYLYITEEAKIWKRIIFAPILVLSFPFLIVSSSLSLASYSSIVQLSWFFPHWYKEVSDLEKGFHNWLCSIIDLPECSPRQIVILDDDVLFECDSPMEGTSAMSHV